jgi:hypothetical protein
MMKSVWADRSVAALALKSRAGQQKKNESRAEQNQRELSFSTEIQGRAWAGQKKRNGGRRVPRFIQLFY